MTNAKAIRSRTMAVLVVACMMLCVLSPAIINWNEEGSFAETGESEKEKFVYVSLGDSTSNGYGLEGYWPDDNEDNNVRGFLQEAPAAYPTLIKKMLSETYDVELIQLAVSGYRTDELRFLLDDTFYGDETMDDVFNMIYDEEDEEWEYGWNFDLVDYLDEMGIIQLPEDATYESLGMDYVEYLREFYRDSIADADLITYAHGTNNFGTYVTHALAALLINGGEGLRIPDLTDYIDPDYVEVYNEFRAELGSVIKAMLLERGIDEGLLDTLGTLLTIVADVFTYGYISFIVNYDVTMEKIYELNPDANVLVVPVYNMIAGVDFAYEDIRIPVGDIYGYVIESANLYAKYLSPYAVKTTPVETYGEPMILVDEMKAGDLSDAAKRGIADGFGFVNLIKGNIIDAMYDLGIIGYDEEDNPFFNEDGIEYLGDTWTYLSSLRDAELRDEKADWFDDEGDVKAEYKDEYDAEIMEYVFEVVIDSKYAEFCEAPIDGSDFTIEDNADLYDFVDIYISKGKLTPLLAEIANAEVIDLMALLGGLDFDNLIGDIAKYITGEGEKPDESNFGIYHIYMRTILADGLFIHPNATGYEEIAQDVWDAYLFSISGESKGLWFDLYEMYLEGGMPMVEEFINEILAEYKEQLDEIIAELKGHIDELMEELMHEAEGVVIMVEVLKQALDILEQNVAEAFELIENGAEPSEALKALEINELYTKGVGILTELVSMGYDCAKVPLAILNSEEVTYLLEQYNLFVENEIDDLVDWIDAMIDCIWIKINNIKECIEAKIEEIIAYIDSDDFKATMYVLLMAYEQLEENLEYAEQLLMEGEVTAALMAINLVGVYGKTLYCLLELIDDGSETAEFVFTVLTEDEVIDFLIDYNTAIQIIGCIEFSVKMIIEDLTIYDDSDDSYYACDYPLFVTDRGTVSKAPASESSELIDEVVDTAGTFIGELRLMDMVAYFSGESFDGRVEISDEVKSKLDGYQKDFYKSNVVIFEANSGNTMFLLNEILAFEDAEPLDFGHFSSIIGDEGAAFMNDIEKKLQPIFDALAEEFPEFAMGAEMVTFIAERLAYMGLATMQGIIQMPSVLMEENELMTIMYAGLHNPLDGVTLVLDGRVIPIGDIMDVYVSVFNCMIYQICERLPQVVYVDVTDMYPEAEIEIRDDMSEEELKAAIVPILSRMLVDTKYVYEQAMDFLDDMEEIPVYNTYWMDGNGDIVYEVINDLEKFHDVTEYNYGDNVPVRDMDDDYRYVFNGTWDTFTDDFGKRYYRANFDQIDRKPVIDVDDNKATVDITKLDESVTEINIDNNGVVVSIPKEIFAGCQSAVVTVEPMEKSKLPANVQQFVGDKIVFHFELVLDGKVVSDFGDATVTFSVPYTPASGEDMSTITVWFMDEDAMELVKCKKAHYDEDSEKIVVETDHFSYWMIGHEAPVDDGEKEAFPVAYAVLLVAILGLCAVLLRLKK